MTLRGKEKVCSDLSQVWYVSGALCPRDSVHAHTVSQSVTDSPGDSRLEKSLLLESVTQISVKCGTFHTLFDHKVQCMIMPSHSQ